MHGPLEERFFHLNQLWVEKFDVWDRLRHDIHYHPHAGNKPRNMAKFYCSLFYTSSLPWTSLYISCIHLNREELN